MTTTPRFVVRLHQANWSFEDLRAVWLAADELGFDGGSLFDLLTAPCLECWTALTALVTATRRLMAVPLVLAPAYRHPVLLAKMAASLDALSGGRLLLGLGTGGSRSDYEAAGLPWEAASVRADRLIDYVRILRHFWSGAEEPFTSRFYGTIQGPGYPTPVQAGGPPVLIGGHGPRHLLRAVSEVADYCNIGFNLSPADWQTWRDRLADGCRAAGRNPADVGLTHNANVIIGADRADLDRRLAEAAHQQGQSPADLRRSLGSAIVGTPDECRDRLHEYIDLGVSWFFLLFPDMPALDSLRLFGETVLPSLRDQTAE